jgi:tetratricopeptide (TPR) repeat protein
MIPPTGLPSGNALRDICVRELLADSMSTSAIHQLLSTPAYQALLPESVLQLMGSTIGRAVDRFVARVLKSAKVNDVHLQIAKNFSRIFTTNFDLCFERAGARRTVHLHGSVENPELMQNQVFRLGKTAEGENRTFQRAMHQRILLVVGYSLRDNDVLKSLNDYPPKLILYLSFDGSLPEANHRISCQVRVAKGSAEELFGVQPQAISSMSQRPIVISPRKIPPLKKRVNALLRICSRAARYDLALTLIELYQPFLSGRSKLAAKCEVADNLRISRRFEEAMQLCQEVLNDPAARRLTSADMVSTAHVQLGLCDLDRGSREFDIIEKHFMTGLEIFEALVKRERDNKYAVENDIWRARIFNNLGLLYAAKGDHKKSIEYFTKSLKIKARHHEQYGYAQTLSNVAKVQISSGHIKKAVLTLTRVVNIMREVPDPYICQDAVIEILFVLKATRLIKLQTSSIQEAMTRSDEWWRKVRRLAAKSDALLTVIVDNLMHLRRIWQKVVK